MFLLPPTPQTTTSQNTRARKRLETRRRTARQRAILEQIRAEIAFVVQKRKGNDAKRHLPPAQPGIPVPGHDTSDGKRAKLQNCNDAPETETSATAADRRRTGLGPSQDETRKDAPNGCGNTNVSWTEYICPYCQISVQSTVRNGNVQVGGHCSKQFRVRLLPYVRRRGPIFMRSGTHPDQAQKTERKSMPDHAMARKVNASDARGILQRKTYKKKKRLASSKNNLRAKKDLEANLSRFCAQAIAKLQPEKSRNVAFGTH